MFFDLSAPEYENFTLCGKCGYAALAFDNSSQIIGLTLLNLIYISLPINAINSND